MADTNPSNDASVTGDPSGRPARRNIRVVFDFADAYVGYEWTDQPVRPIGGEDFGVFATFGEAKASALRHLRAERDRWVDAIQDHRDATIDEVRGQQ